MKNLAWIVLALSLSACSSSSTNSSGGLQLAGTWNGVMNSGGGVGAFFNNQRFMMTIRQANNSTLLDGTLSFVEVTLDCGTAGGRITASSSIVGSRVRLQIEGEQEGPVLLSDGSILVDADGMVVEDTVRYTFTFTGNASDNRMDGTWFVEGGGCGFSGGNWVANRRV